MAECYDGWSTTFCSFTPSALGRRLTKNEYASQLPGYDMFVFITLFNCGRRRHHRCNCRRHHRPSVMIFRRKWGSKQGRAERMERAFDSAEAAEGSAAVGSPSQFYQKSVGSPSAVRVCFITVSWALYYLEFTPLLQQLSGSERKSRTVGQLWHYNIVNC